MKRIIAPCLALACILSVSAEAQEMPAPHRMPRTPVSSQLIVQSHDPMPASREVQGPAAIIDGEKLRIGDADIRLFGVVPPQLAASFGPQARTALDMLANGQNVTCQIRDRDRDGRLLATCHNANGSDMALELLRHGLAVTARGSIAGTELATPYLAAEQAAQNQKIGLWSVSVPAAAAPVTTPKVESVALPTDADAKKEDRVTPRTDKTSTTEQNNETQAKIAADIISQHAQTSPQAQTQLDDTVWTNSDSVGFFERYQILIAGFLMLITALSIIGALWAHKRRDRLDEIKAIAAALRGELMAARGVCYGRIKTIHNEDDDRAAIWPRIRSTLYQAYVARLGLLGAELARQVASLYGQSSDYAALYHATATSTDAPKRQALETLLRNIDEVLPKLAGIEQTGIVPTSFPIYRTPRSRYDVPSVPATPPKALLAPVASTRAQPAVIEKIAEVTDKATANPSEEAEPSSKMAPVMITPAPASSAPKESTPSALTASASATQAAATLAAAPVLLWEAVRGFIQNHRNAMAEPHAPHDPHSVDYAEIIEADMARYQYGENIETFDISPQKKSG